MSVEAASALRAAADLIEQRGWVPHLGRGRGGPCCLVEAVTLVTIPSEALFDEATEALRQRLGTPSLAEWNDRQTHSGPVVALLRAAAEGPQQPTGQATQGPAGGEARPSPGQTGSVAMTCPTCGSPNIEENDPHPGEHTCRDCGEWLDEPSVLS